MNKLLLIMLSILVGLKAHAGFYLDPYIGYGTISLTSDVPNDDDEDQSGTFIGSKVGYKFTLFSAGLDVSGGTTQDLSRTNTAVFVGFDLPILFRFYGEYILTSDLDNDNNKLNFDYQNGYVLGVGFTGLPFVSLNFEYNNTVYETKVLGSTYDIDTEGYLLSVSLPLDF